MRKNSWVSGFICAWVVLAFLVFGVVHHERHGRAQSSTQGSSGMPSPIANGAGAPGNFFTCNTAFSFMEFVNTSNFTTYYCDGTNWNQTKSSLSGTSGTITGTLLAAGASDTGTVTVAGATAGMSCGAVAATDGTVINSFVLSCAVTGSGSSNVTVSVMSPVLGTPPSKAYNFKVWP